jgi:hypothetical protein
MAPGQSAFRSPGTLRSRCLDHRQLGQWLRWDVPGASSETSTPQCPHRNERGNDKSGDPSEQCLETGQTFRLLSCSPGDTADRAGQQRPPSWAAAPSVKQISSPQGHNSATYAQTSPPPTRIADYRERRWAHSSDPDRVHHLPLRVGLRWLRRPPPASARAHSRPSLRATDGVPDHHWLPAGTSQRVRRRPVVSVVAKHELRPAPLDHVPLAGVEHRLELIQASSRGGPVTIAIPGKPAPAAQPHAQPVQGSQRDQDDRQAGDRHEEQHSHTRATPWVR